MAAARRAARAAGETVLTRAREAAQPLADAARRQGEQRNRELRASGTRIVQRGQEAAADVLNRARTYALPEARSVEQEEFSRLQPLMVATRDTVLAAGGWRRDRRRLRVDDHGCAACGELDGGRPDPRRTVDQAEPTRRGCGGRMGQAD